MDQPTNFSLVPSGGPQKRKRPSDADILHSCSVEELEQLVKKKREEREAELKGLVKQSEAATVMHQSLVSKLESARRILRKDIQELVRAKEAEAAPGIGKIVSALKEAGANLTALRSQIASLRGEAASSSSSRTENEAREKEAREKEAREREAREKLAREREAKDKLAREKEAEREARRKDRIEREAREREARENEARERLVREREAERVAEREARKKETRAFSFAAAVDLLRCPH